jgi:hypothetical protein
MWFEDHIGGLLEGTGVRTTVLTVLNRTLFASVLFKKIYFYFIGLQFIYNLLPK